MTPPFEDEYAAPPGKCPRFKPPIEAILIIVPFRCASRMRVHTYFDTNQVPVKFVLNTWFHSSSDHSKDDLTFPAQHKNQEIWQFVASNYQFHLVQNQELWSMLRPQQHIKLMDSCHMLQLW